MLNVDVPRLSRFALSGEESLRRAGAAYRKRLKAGGKAHTPPTGCVEAEAGVSEAENEAVSALVKLGWARTLAQTRVEKAVSAGIQGVEALIVYALNGEVQLGG